MYCSISYTKARPYCYLWVHMILGTEYKCTNVNTARMQVLAECITALQPRHSQVTPLYLSCVGLFLLINSELLESTKQHPQHSLVPVMTMDIRTYVRTFVTHTHASVSTWPATQPVAPQATAAQGLPSSLLLTLPCPWCLPVCCLTGPYCSSPPASPPSLQLPLMRGRAAQGGGGGAYSVCHTVHPPVC